MKSVLGDSLQTHGTESRRKRAEAIKGRDEFMPEPVEAPGSFPNSYAHMAVLNDDIIPADRRTYTRGKRGNKQKRDGAK